MFAVTWLLSPHGIEAISEDVATCSFAVADILSKTVYSLVGWHLRWKVLRKASGQLCEETKKAVRRSSFIIGDTDAALPVVVVADFDMPFASYLCSLLVGRAWLPEKREDAASN